MTHKIRIGVDIGGTKIAVAGLDAAGSIVTYDRISTPIDYEAIVSGVQSMVHHIDKKFDTFSTIGVATPGSIDPGTGAIKNSNLELLKGKYLKRDLETTLSRKMILSNDANCFALAEYAGGAGAGEVAMVGVVLSTGVGSGIVINGQLVTGSNCIAGEWGHCSLPWPDKEEYPGPWCHCGKRGCVETFLCGQGLTNIYRMIGGREVSPTQIGSLAKNMDKTAMDTIMLYRRRLAKALSLLLNIVDPDVVVFGGGLTNIQGLVDGIVDDVRPWVFSTSIRTRFSISAHGDPSTVRGAAALVPC
jgi:fructokinase